MSQPNEYLWIMESNVAIVKKAYTSYFGNDGNQLASCLSPDIVWIQQDGHPDGGSYHGIDEVFEKVFQQFASYWSHIDIELLELYPSGEHVFVWGKYMITSMETGKTVQADFLNMLKLKDGLITEYRQFTDTFIMRQSMSNSNWK